MTFHTHTLPNGLQIIGEVSPTARSSAVGFFVRTGARDEMPEVAGVSHFLEHMVFKGTERRDYLAVNLDFDRIGAFNNAYTNEEVTCFYAAVLPEYLHKAIEVTADILRPSLRQEDFDSEKQVILEEISMYDDEPGFAGMDQARKIHYGRHPLGNLVLGTQGTVGAMTRDQMVEYFSRRYAASNVVASVAGKLDWDATVAHIESLCGGWESGTAGRDRRHETTGVGGEHVLTQSKVTQQHVFFIGAGPSADSPLKYAADVLSVAVGDDSGSRLYWELIHNGRADTADIGYSEYDAQGSFYTMLVCDKERAAENYDTVRRVLGEVTRDGLTEDEVTRAKKKIVTRVVRAGEKPMNRMKAIANNWIYRNEYTDVDRELAAYEAVTAEDIRKMLLVYPMDRVTAVAYGPLESLAG